MKELEIKKQIQYLEDILDNLKADTEILFDETIDRRMRERAKRSSIVLVEDDVNIPLTIIGSCLKGYILPKEEN